jgi:hypothetical protein
MEAVTFRKLLNGSMSEIALVTSSTLLPLTKVRSFRCRFEAVKMSVLVDSNRSIRININAMAITPTEGSEQADFACIYQRALLHPKFRRRNNVCQVDSVSVNQVDSVLVKRQLLELE